MEMHLTQYFHNITGNQVENQAVRKFALFGLEVRSSIQLSYRRLKTNYTTLLNLGQG
jgi:hypothetical protein